MTPDVAARLSEGRPAVQHTAAYVAACRALGYAHPDLTGHPAQVCDWYDTETGLDLRVLDDDCAALWGAVTATEEALATQRAQLAQLAAAWRGPAAEAAVRFVQRHTDAAAAVVTRVRAAAEGCSALRDTLWQLVDGKVATAVAVDDRRLAERPAWLLAAQTVTAGVADRSADDIVRQQVNPYVDNDIRIDWLTAMRTTVVSVDASFDAVTDGLAALPDGCFEIAGELGPAAPAPLAPVVAGPIAAVPAVPAAAPAPAPEPAPEPAQPAPESPPPTWPDPGDFGGAGGPGGLGGGIGELIGGIIGGIGGLIGSLADGLGDAVPDDPALPDPLDADEEADDAVGPAAPDAEDAAPAGTGGEETAAPDETPSATVAVVDDQTAAEPPPAPVAESTQAAPPGEKTPCDIAADELPQAGQ